MTAPVWSPIEAVQTRQTVRFPTPRWKARQIARELRRAAREVMADQLAELMGDGGITDMAGGCPDPTCAYRVLAIHRGWGRGRRERDLWGYECLRCGATATMDDLHPHVSRWVSAQSARPRRGGLK